MHKVSSAWKPKSSNILSQRKNFVKSLRKQYGNPDSHAFRKSLPFYEFLLKLNHRSLYWAIVIIFLRFFFQTFQ